MGRDGWIGVDLDGTLAHYDHFEGETVIGAPISEMVHRIKKLINNGHTVKVFTARIHPTATKNPGAIREAIGDWTEQYIGHRLESTCMKDHKMWFCYDDRAVQIEKNTGKILGEDLGE